MSSWQGNYDNAANAPYWAVNSTICKSDIAAEHSRPNETNATYLYGNTTPSAYVTDETIGLFLVDSTEEHAGSDNITDVSIITGGTGYLEVPTVSFSGGGGASAAATASISGGTVTKILITNTGSSYETVPTVAVQAPRITIAGTITQATDTIPYTGHGLAVDEAVKYYNGGGSSATGLVNGTTYYVATAGRTANAFEVKTAANRTAGTLAATVAVSGSAGQFTCGNSTLAVADRVTITGTLGGTATITGYATGTTYKVSAITGTSPNVTGFTLQTQAGGALTTGAGTLTGLTYVTDRVVDISGAGTTAQYFEKVDKVTATAIAVKGLGEGGGTDSGWTHAPHTGWNLKTVGTGGRAGRVTFETLTVVADVKSDNNADDKQLPDA
jgi:hypothetical protein